MGYARCIVTAQLLIDALHLPPDTEVLCVAPNYDGGYCDVELTLSHPDLAQQDAEMPPLVSPSFRKQDPVVFEGWGAEVDEPLLRLRRAVTPRERLAGHG